MAIRYSLLAAASTLGCTATALLASNNGIRTANLTVALVRAPPVNWPEPFWNKNWTGVSFDLPGTVDKGVKYIAEAASNGANLVVFPELWFPGYVRKQTRSHMKQIR